MNINHIISSKDYSEGEVLYYKIAKYCIEKIREDHEAFKDYEKTRQDSIIIKEMSEMITLFRINRDEFILNIAPKLSYNPEGSERFYNLQKEIEKKAHKEYMSYKSVSI